MVREKALKGEIESVEKMLQEKNPSLAKKALGKLNEWGKKVKAWL